MLRDSKREAPYSIRKVLKLKIVKHKTSIQICSPTCYNLFAVHLLFDFKLYFIDLLFVFLCIFCKELKDQKPFDIISYYTVC